MSDKVKKGQSSFDVTEYQRLRPLAVDIVSQRFFDKYPDLMDSFGERGKEATREDVGYTLDFLRPAVEFGLVTPFTKYLIWLCDILSSRGVDAELVWDMLEWLAEFFETQQANTSGSNISATLYTALKILKYYSGDEKSQLDINMPEAWPDADKLEKALLKGDLKQAREIFNEHLKAGKGFLEIELHLIQPALYQVGWDWQKNLVSVAQEHLATSTAITMMALEFSQAELGEPNGKSVICACVEGNNHAVGLRIVADAFELNGWDVKFLGADVPKCELIKMLQADTPDLLCLSLSMPDHLPVAKSTIKEVHLALGEASPAIMIGGLAINAFPAVIDTIGADKAAVNALQAVEVNS
jgi:MerR family transcriptional regulator, light-induced transcriptional regulator